MTDTITTEPTTLDEAQRAAAAAAEHLAELEARRATGDQGVTVDDLADANRAVYLARLTVDDAQRTADEAARAAVEKTRATSYAAAVELLDAHSVAAVGQQWATARRELVALVDAIDARTQAIHAAGGQLAAGGWPQGTAESGQPTVAGYVPGWVRVDRTDHEAAGAGDVVLQLVLDVARTRRGLPGNRYTSVTKLLEGKIGRTGAAAAIEAAGRDAT